MIKYLVPQCQGGCVPALGQLCFSMLGHNSLIHSFFLRQTNKIANKSNNVISNVLSQDSLKPNHFPTIFLKLGRESFREEI